METHSYKRILKTKGFIFYLIAEFLGAMNDNVLRMILGLMALDIGLYVGDKNAISAMGVSAVGAVFILPFLLFSGISGHISDVFSKRRVLIVTKCLEVVTMSLALIILPMQIFWLALLLLFLMSTQSTFFSPSKYGILPELFSEKDLSRVNGLVEMTTYSAIILGLFVGGIIFYYFAEQKVVIASFLLMIAIIGTTAIFFIPQTPYPGSNKPLSLHPFREIVAGSKKIFMNKKLLMTVSGIVWFWFMGSMIQSIILLLGRESLGLNDFWISFVLAFLGVGVAVGALMAGRFSGDRIELGIVPMGALGIGIGGILLNLATPNIVLTVACLMFMGFSGGLFIVPLIANLQHLAGIQEKGKLIATTNVFSMGAVLLASIVLPLLHDLIGFSSDFIVLILGIATVAVTLYAAILMPMVLLRCALWVLTHSLYSIKVRGRHNVPEKGPALLVCNHVSYADGFLVGGAIPRHVWFMLIHDIYHIPFLEKFFRLMKVIPVYKGRKMVKTFEQARAALEKGELVCIFAEGGISRNGHILSFRKGLEKITEGLSVPIIPVNMDGVWGSVLSYHSGRFFFKLPKRFPYPLTVTFGKPFPANTPKEVVRQEVKELEAEALPLRREVQDVLPNRFIKAARGAFFKKCMVDSTGADLTFGKALIGAIALNRKIVEQTKDQEMIGILLPSSVGGALTNLAVSLTGKVAVNLNFTVGKEAFESAIEQCKIKTIYTSRKFIEKIEMEPRPEMVFLEDLRKTITGKDRLKAALTAMLPARFIMKMVCVRDITPKSVATILFSSGSTGKPKGVMLSHTNILANIEGGDQIIPVDESDRFMGVLPFFHSFGYTVLLWYVMVKKMSIVYHPNPLDAKVIGEMIYDHKATIMVATPTFYQSYIRTCKSYQFESLRLAVTGAEKLRKSVAESFREKFGLDLLEGYGCTELSPVVSVNIPDVVASDGWRQVGRKEGTVGTAIPGVATKVVHPETMEDLPLGEEGMLLVKGGTTMVGYYNQAELTREAFHGSWYITGDIAKLDDGGFITIVDRLSRFSKIAGEMVPHINIENSINEILGGPYSCVTTVTSSRKGEALAVLYTHKSLTGKDLWSKLKETDLPNIWIPKADSFLSVDNLPVMGTGKTDLREVKRIAQERLGE